MTNAHANKRILVADDDELIRRVLELSLTRKGWTVTCAEDGNSALALWTSGTYDVLSTDLDMPGLDGLSLTKRIREVDASARIFMFSGGNNERETEFLRLGGTAFVAKPNTGDYIKALEAFVTKGDGL